MTDRLTPGPRQPAYDAVFAYIRSQPRDLLPTTIVDRNAMIWRAVHAALDAAGIPKPEETDTTQPEPACQPACAEQHTYDWNCHLLEGADHGPEPTEAEAVPEGLREQYRAALARFIDPDDDTMPTLSDDGHGFTWVTADSVLDKLMRVRDREVQTLRGMLDGDGLSTVDEMVSTAEGLFAECAEQRQRAERLAATLREVLNAFTTARRDDGVIAGHLLEGAIHPDDMNRWRSALDGQRDGHIYLSTGCHHDDHGYCQGMTGLNGAKRPGECKHCGTKCICPCHMKDQL